MEKKETVYQYIHETTLSRIKKRDLDALGFDSLDISQGLKMDRANASRLLNQLSNDGRLIKKLDRPVLFYDRACLESHAPGVYIPSVIQKEIDIQTYIHPIQEATENKKDTVNSFSRYMTNSLHSRMKEPVEKAKSAMLYPGMLNVLIIGERGAGRLQFAKCIFNFAKEIEAIENNSKIVVVECLNYANQDTDIFLKLIFGEYLPETNKYKRGIFNTAQNGIVIFNNINKLADEAVSALYNAILEKTFSSIGSNKTFSLSSSIIATSFDTHTLDNSDVHRCFPMLINLPNLHELSILEKIMLTLQYFQSESNQIDKTIRISKDALSCFVMSEYKGNLAHLRSEIRQACAISHHEYLKKHSIYLDINFDSISTQVLNDIHDVSERIEELHETLNIFQNEYLFFSPNQNNEELTLLHDLNEPAEDKEGLYISESHEDLIIQCINDINQSKKPHIDSMRSIGPKIIYDIIYPVVENLSLSKNENILFGLVDHLSSYVSNVETGTRQSMFPALSTRIAKEDDYQIAKKIDEKIYAQYGFQLSQAEMDYTATYLYLSSQWINKEYIQLLLCFNDFAIAKNYTNFLNSQNNNVIVESIMLHDLDNFENMKSTLIDKIQSMDRGKGVIIATDIPEVLNVLKPLERKNHFLVTTNISLQYLIAVLSKIETLGASIYSMNLEQSPVQEKVFNHVVPNNNLLNEIQNKILAGSLTFLNPEKACQSLYNVMLGILDELNISYSDDILIKFLFHTTFAIERCIKKEPYIYPKGKTLIKQYPELYEVLEKNFQIIYEIFSVSFPVSEIGYLIEIFLPYMNNNQ